MMKALTMFRAAQSKAASQKADIDWDMWESKIISPGVVDFCKKELSAMPAAELPAEIQAKFDAINAKCNQQMAELKKNMKTDEAAKMAQLDKMIADAEMLKKQIEGIRELTVAEVLESNPEMRKEIEDEIKNHVWA